MKCVTCIHFELCAYASHQLPFGCDLYKEPVRHGRWIDRYGNKYANHLYECSECKGKALYNIEVDVLGRENLVQVLSAACPHCRAKMDVTDINVGNKRGDNHDKA